MSLGKINISSLISTHCSQGGTPWEQCVEIKIYQVGHGLDPSQDFSGLSQDFLITFSGHPQFGTNYIGLVKVTVLTGSNY